MPTPRRTLLHRRCDQIAQADGAGADEDDLAGKGRLALGLGHLVLHQAPGGDDAILLRFGEAQPHLALRRGRDFELADADGDNVAAVAALLAAGVVRPDHDRARLLGDAQRFQSEGRQQLIALAGDEGRAANNAVSVADGADKTRPRRAVHQAGQGRNGVEEGRHIGRRRSADGHASGRRGNAHLGIVGEEVAEDDRGGGDGVGQRPVGIGQPCDDGRGFGVATGAQAVGEQRGRGAIGFGEDEVISDDRGAGFCETVGQGGDLFARPRPLTQTPDGLIVDVDDADRDVFIGARRGALIGIEDGEAQAIHDRHADDLEDRHGDHGRHAQPDR